jgi:hypothetical protein
VEYKNKVGTKARRRKQIISCEPSHSREKQPPKGRKRLCSAALAIATQAKGTHEQTDAAQQACRRTPGPAADTCVWGRKALIRRHTHDGHTILGDYCMGLDDPQCCLGTRPPDFSDPGHFCAGALYASDKRDRADATVICQIGWKFSIRYGIVTTRRGGRHRRLSRAVSPGCGPTRCEPPPAAPPRPPWWRTTAAALRRRVSASTVGWWRPWWRRSCAAGSHRTMQPSLGRRRGKR